jgi:hypothetical protein
MVTHYFQPAKSTADILADISRLSTLFNEKSNMDKQIAETLDAAGTALKSEQEKVAALQAKLAALENKDVYKKAKHKNFSFLLEGSGMMLNSRGLDAEQPQKSLFEIANAALENFKEKSGSDAEIDLFADKFLGSDADFEAESKHVNYESTYIGVIENKEPIALLTKEQNMVVIGRGDLFDPEFCKDKTRGLLTVCPKMSLDFVAMDSTFDMKRLAQELQAEFPARISFQQVDAELSMEAALVKIVKSRTASAPKKELQSQPKR